MKSAVDNSAQNVDNPLGELGLLRWVRSLAFRVPKAAVVLVGTKCDLVPERSSQAPLDRIEDAAETIENKIQREVDHWVEKAAAAKNAKRARTLVAASEYMDSSPSGICVEEGMSLVSFSDFTGFPRVDGAEGWSCDVNAPGLLGRIIKDSRGEFRAVSMRLPLSWHRALEFLDKCAEAWRYVDLIMLEETLHLCTRDL